MGTAFPLSMITPDQSSVIEQREGLEIEHSMVGHVPLNVPFLRFKLSHRLYGDYLEVTVVVRYDYYKII